MTRQDVVDRLMALGLTTYEAKVFSALTRLGEAGVADIHAVAEVPRSAVYGTLEKLERMGIIESSTGRPKKFRALPPRVAVSKIESELLGALRDARDGLEELASAPHKGASDARIWVIRGQERIRQRLEGVVGSAKSELTVAGTSAHMLSFVDVWKKAKSRKVLVTFATQEPEMISELSRYGKIIRPKYLMKMNNVDQPKMLFVRADRKTVLFASEYADDAQGEGMTAFWTDDESIVKFMNYLTDSMSPHPKGTKGV